MSKFDFTVIGCCTPIDALGKAWKEGKELEKEEEFWELARCQRDDILPQLILNFVDLALGYYCRHRPEMIPQLSFLRLSPNPQERAMFAHLVGYAGRHGLSVSSEIFTLASDPIPVVRFRAIQSLVRLRDLGLQGIEATIEKAKTDSDEDVREVANGTSF